MKAKFLYLDDEELARILPAAEAVAGKGDELTIEILHPAKFEGNFAKLTKKLKNYQGLILDWRLDTISDPDEGKKFTFRAGAVAQEIRNRENDEKEAIAPLPIVLWSTQEKLAASFNRDFTSHDLFDFIYIKDNVSENPKRIRQELLSFVSGYATISKFNKKSNGNIHELLNIEKESLDIRIQERFKGDHFPTHEYARFIYRELIERPGLLIDEYRLAARLGISRAKSKDWQKLLEIIKEYQYTGPFHEAWSRWWSNELERRWWTVVLEQTKPLSLLLAEDRVKIIKELTGLKRITHATPIKKNYRSRFYTICEHCKEPLDPIDGVIISEKDPKPWQERRYISLDVALEGRGGFVPDAIEKARLSRLKKKGK